MPKTVNISLEALRELLEASVGTMDYHGRREGCPSCERLDRAIEAVKAELAQETLGNKALGYGGIREC